VALDLSHRHATRIEAQNLLIEAAKPGLSLGDQLGLETASAIAWYRDLDLAIIRQDRLRTRPVAAVALPAGRQIALLIAEVVGQFRAKRPLD
jgi:hypothetical protein